MSFERIKSDLSIISKLSDDPNGGDGLSADELKAKFDEAGNILKTWINTIFLTALEAKDASESIGVDIPALPNVKSVNEALVTLYNAIGQSQQASILNGSVTEEKLRSADANGENGAVSTAKINNGAVTGQKIAANAVDSTKIANNAVTENKIDNLAVTTEKINDGAVTSAKLGNLSVSANKIAANAVSVTASNTMAAAFWSGDSAPYTYIATADGVLETDDPIVDLIPNADYETAMAEEEAWSSIYKAVAGNNTITFYAKKKPTISLTYKARCIRK